MLCAGPSVAFSTTPDRPGAPVKPAATLVPDVDVAALLRHVSSTRTPSQPMLDVARGYSADGDADADSDADSADRRRGVIVLSWDVPASDGGGLLTGYEVQVACVAARAGVPVPVAASGVCLRDVVLASAGSGTVAASGKSTGSRKGAAAADASVYHTVYTGPSSYFALVAAVEGCR